MQSSVRALNVNGSHASCLQHIRTSPAAAQPRSAAARHICMCSRNEVKQDVTRRQIAAFIVSGTMAVGLLTGQSAQAAAAQSFAVEKEEKPAAEKYQLNSSSNKAQASAKRKAELSKKRAQRVAAGGATDGNTDGAAAKETFNAATVDKATKEAEDSNAIRAAEADRMMASIRSKAEGYKNASANKLKTNY